ncbi:hypothetical protein CVIRNUC_001965 [Coccomyxa viridis]|uniref:Uncharacterized protein n=1 Tax=Coccomyxa viridis TaxID=1274662 RepID=A0AAV1HVL3_9CHLO|nr:hypothetical protein CVIRNUC_001965 [Coccomyxa viridis]
MAETHTRNQRLYPQSSLRTECLAFHRDQVIKGQAYGYLRHPERSSPGYLFVDPTIASHQVIALWWKGLALHGIVRLLATTAGQKARDMLEKGCRLGASARCWGSVEITRGSGMQTVHNNCRLITFDLTEEPATGLFLQPLTTSPAAELLPSILSGEHQQSLALQSAITHKEEADGAANEAY